jgi:gamma-glutamyltranspeptidase / glutathione hydrolase
MRSVSLVVSAPLNHHAVLRVLNDTKRVTLLYSLHSFPVIVFFLFAALLPCAGVAQERPAISRHGMVVSAHPLASEAGVEILKQGGNAIDAAVATEFALAVTFPIAGNIGGGGFMMIRLANGESYALDYREKAPLRATRTMYLDSLGNAIDEKSKIGHLAVGVPGAVAGMLEAHRRFGKLPLSKVIAPAIRLAEKGHDLLPFHAELLNQFSPTLRRFEASSKIFTKPDSIQVWRVGDRFVQPDLAQTLRRIQKNGRDGFYKGKTADLLIAEMKQHGGLISQADLDKYQPVWREPLRGSYRGYEVMAMPPPSSGGIILLSLLGMVEPHDLKNMGYQSSATLHLYGEAMRRVFADRAEFLGDPDFVRVPTTELLSPSYRAARMKSFNPDKTTPSKDVRAGNPTAKESMETTHYSVVDADGNAVSTTTTLNGAYGSCVTVSGAGFLLNNEMDDFSVKPGVPNLYGVIGGDANAIAPEKRMLSSMSPTIVTRNGKPAMVVGSPGGSTIPTQVFQVITNVIDFEMNMQSAVAAKRIHHQWLPDAMMIEKNSPPMDVRKGLEKRGWSFIEREAWGQAEGIFILPTGEKQGGADPRGENKAVGY